MLFCQRAVFPFGVGGLYLCDIEGIHQLTENIIGGLGGEVGLCNAMTTDAPFAKSLLAHLGAIVL